MNEETYQRRFEERFWAKVDIRGPDECWLWNASKNNMNYGMISYHYKMKLAHRLSWELHNREIPIGMLVCHSCDNPAHLFLGTVKENGQDMAAKSRGNTVKLTVHDVLDIKSKYTTGTSQEKLARMYGVGQTAISKIVTGKTWSAIE